MAEKGLFEGAFLNEPSIFQRLLKEFTEGFREFFQDPAGYITSAIKGDGVGGKQRQERLMFGGAMAVFVFATLAILILVPWAKLFGEPPVEASEEVTEVFRFNPDDFKQQPVEAPKDGKKASGGGGGGRKTVTPPSKGQLPKFSLTPPIIAPRPEPTLKPPVLPVTETIQVDPRLEPKRDDIALTGLPNGIPGPPSAGPGSGGGIGTGEGGGIGSGGGRGLGPGNGYNTGGGDPGLGSGSGNTPASVVDAKPVPLNRPRPNYTEEARKNKIQGVVRVRVLVGPDGGVKQVRVVGGGLPDGLNEQAISAAYQIRFRPAMKDGRPVAFWIPVDIEFNLR